MTLRFWLLGDVNRLFYRFVKLKLDTYNLGSLFFWLIEGETMRLLNKDLDGNILDNVRLFLIYSLFNDVEIEYNLLFWFVVVEG